MNKAHYRQLLPYLRPHWLTLAIATSCTLGYVLTMPLIAYLLGQVAEYIGQKDLEALLLLPVLAALLFVMRGIFEYGQDALMAGVAFQVAMTLRLQTYAHLQRLNFDYFERAQTGDLTYRLTEDVDRIGEVLNKLFHQALPCVLQLIAILAYMLYLNWPLTLTTLLLAPVMAGLIGWFGERLLALSRRSQNQVSTLSALLTEVFGGIRLVKAFAAEDYEIRRFAQAADRNRQAKYATERIKAIQYPVVGFLEAIAVALLFLLGGWQIIDGNLTGSEFISFITAVALIIDPINLLTANFNEYKQGQASVDRVFELLAVQPKVIDSPDAIILSAVQGKVEYRDVSFAYRPGQPILKRLNLIAQPGEAIALVGASGAGKTTLVNLLPRFYNFQAGQILIDGIDIQSVTLSSLRQQIGIVPQETLLFSGTIARNIAFGQTHFDLKAVRDAAKVANAHEFILQFPEGYETQLGERGVTLSGGQRQRLAIARAVLLNPRILILDEATSALDSESEALVQEALERLMQGRTVFIIAHRLTTVRRASRILVLEQGQVVESGTHTELSSQPNSRYASFCAQQYLT
ncbi:putative ABC transporter ATP-binding protein [Acaryochloris thomasi RCC1774]|uniref:Putative ABC transporter ATP-binding protein n=1 Tax=Acaryochloris thomasi RCC1774 TaxID=1764569 RepID=A0A2W1JE33_9CYAN|nr:ABC transporter ATP-binding protein [Acaryochloris thomasi]PZD72019.1 putative ABC transporter ATP-binding protein [Acaryochloris thomasi RCC1774]